MPRCGLTLAYVATAAAFMRDPMASKRGATLPKIDHILNLNTMDRRVLSAGKGNVHESQRLTLPTPFNQSFKRIPEGEGGSDTESKQEFWFHRLGYSKLTLVFSITLIAVSTSCMWLTEKRVARVDSVIAFAKREVKSASARQANRHDRGHLVHIQDGETKATEPVELKMFSDLKFETGCLRLRSKVEIFQWNEINKRSQRTDNAGNTVRSKYTYEKDWSTKAVNPMLEFKESDAKLYTNAASSLPKGVVVGESVANGKKVQYGAFLLPTELLTQLNNFISIPSDGDVVKLGDKVTSQDGDAVFSKDEDGLYYLPPKRDSPELGDIRVTFDYVPPGSASVLALQCEESPGWLAGFTMPSQEEIRAAMMSGGPIPTAQPRTSGKDTFIPYRLFPRRWCGMSDDDKQRAALKEGNRNVIEFMPEEVYTGPFACCCCACNLVGMYFALSPPQVFHVAEGSFSEKQFFDKLKAEANPFKNCCRVCGWLPMLIAFHALFCKLPNLMDLIPFLGPFIFTFGNYWLWMACFLATLVVWLSFVCLAYLPHRPVVALVYALLVALIVAIPLEIIPTIQEDSATSF